MELRVLGPVEICTDDNRNSLDGAKQRTVLAALLLAGGRMVSDRQLSELLWGTEPPTTMNAQIYTYISRLRKLLRDGATIVRQRPGYLLRTTTARFDFAEFERLSGEGRTALREERHDDAARHFRAGLALWRGPALTDVTEFLADVELPRLEEARMAALESRIEADLALGRHAHLIAELTGLVAAYPLAERIRAQLMTALFRSDRQADALAVYDAGRRILAEELGVDPGPALTRTHREVLRGEPVAPGAPPATVRAGTAWRRPRPAMLPADLPDFTGREAEVDRLCREVTAGRGGVALVTGMPGVGKSALAVRALHRCRGNFPDGQLYADLGGATGRPLAPADVLHDFLLALGVREDAIPTDERSRVALYRSQLAGHRVLVLLDNAADDRQVGPLLPGSPGCAVVVTSRVPLGATAGVRPVRLDPLPDHQAEQLLRAGVQRERTACQSEAVRRIVQLCGGLPLALRAAVARLTSRPLWTLAYLASRLGEHRALDELRLGDIDVRSSLTASYRTLSPPARLTLRRLALLDVDTLPFWAPAAVRGVAEDAADDVTAELVEAGLLDVAGTDAHGGPRYRFHPLVRQLARERAVAEDSESDRAAALDRAFGAWLWLAGEADRGLPDRDTTVDRGPRLAPGDAPRWRLGARLATAVGAAPVPWFVGEDAALSALVRQTAAIRPTTAWEFAHAVAHHLELSGRYDDWRRGHRQALGAARAAGQHHGEAVLLLDLARLSAAVDDVAARLSYGDRAARLFEALSDPGRESHALVHVGTAYRLSGHLDRALPPLERALDRARQADDPGARAGAEQALGDLLRDRGDLAGAVERLGRALALWRRRGDRRGTASALLRLGEVDRCRDRLTDAATAHTQALDLARAAGDQALEGLALVGQARVDQATGEVESARTGYDEAVRIFEARRLTRRSGHAHVLHGLGELALSEGRVAVAVRLLADAADAWHRMAMPLRQAATLACLGDAQVAAGRLDDAVATWQAVSDVRARLTPADAPTPPGRPTPPRHAVRPVSLSDRITPPRAGRAAPPPLPKRVGEGVG